MRCVLPRRVLLSSPSTLLGQLLSSAGPHINQLSYDVVPASNTARFLIFSGVIALFATAVIIATKGQLGRAKQAIETDPVSLIQTPSRKVRQARLVAAV